MILKNCVRKKNGAGECTLVEDDREEAVYGTI